MPAVGQREGEIHAEALLVKRRDGAEDDREGGRAFSSALPPATASAMRISGRASVASLMLTTMLCLREARTQASNSCRTRMSSGRVLGRDDRRGGREVGQAVDDAGRLVHVLLDARPHVPSRRARRWRSRRRRGRRARRPAAGRTRGAAAEGEGARQRRERSSTAPPGCGRRSSRGRRVAPWASSTSRRAGEWNMTPVSASTSSEASWMRSTSASAEDAQRAPPPTYRPAA